MACETEFPCPVLPEPLPASSIAVAEWKVLFALETGDSHWRNGRRRVSVQVNRAFYTEDAASKF